MDSPKPRPLKIALWNNLPSGGGKRALWEIVRGLQARGHTFESWCPPTANRDYLPLADHMPEHVLPYTSHPRKRRDQLLPGRHGWAKHYQAIEEHCLACATAMNTGDFDVVFSANCLEFATPPLARFLRRPNLLYCQEPARGHFEAPFQDGTTPAGRGGPRHVTWPHKAFQLIENAWTTLAIQHERQDAAAFDLILANSNYSRERLAQAYGLDSTVAYLGINTELFRPQHLPREPFVLGLSVLLPHKDPQLAIRALATLPPASRPALKWIGYTVGDSPYLPQTEALAQRLGVDFQPLLNIPDAQVVAWLNRAAALVFCSRLEPFGFAPLEANACGTPVVAIAEGGVRETIIDNVNGLLVPNRDPVALGSALSRVLADPALAERLGTTGQRIVSERWQWSGCVDQIETLLRDLAQAAPAINAS